MVGTQVWEYACDLALPSRLSNFWTDFI